MEAIDAGGNVLAWMVYVCTMGVAYGVLWLLFWINFGR